MKSTLSRILAAAAATVTAAASAVAGAAVVAPAASAAPGGNIVMLGDSYFANTRLEQAVGAVTGLGERGCVKGEFRPATEVARITGAHVDDFSCNGAKLYMPGHSLASHLEEAIASGALNAGTRMVPLMFGANDTFATLDPIDNNAAAAAYDRAAQRIRQVAPNAKILFVSYPTISNDRAGVCPIRLNGLPPTEMPIGVVREAENQVWEQSRSAAQRNGGEFLDLRTQTRGHDMCQPGGGAWVAGVLDNQTPQYNLTVHFSGDGVRNAAEQISARY